MALLILNVANRMLKKTILFAKKHLKNNLIQGTIIVTTASLFSNFFAYLFQLLMGRALSVNEYGVLISLFSIQAIITLPMGVIANAITKIVSEVKEVNYPKGLSYFFYSIFRINFVISLLISLVFYLFRYYISRYLNITNVELFKPFTLLLFVGLIFSFNTSFLQALKRYKALSADAFARSFFKFVVAVLVFYFSFGLDKAFYLLSFFILLAGIFGYGLLSKNIRFEYRKFNKSNLKRIVSFSLGSTFTFLGLSLIFNNDVLLVKHLFSPETAGYYSSASVMGHIIFYGVSPIATVLFPVCAERYHQRKNYLEPLIKGISIVGILSLIGFIAMYFFPSLVVNILFGAKYLNSIKYIPLYALYMVFYSLVSVLGWLLVAISKLKTGSFAFLAAVLQYLLIKFVFNNSVEQVLYVSITVSFILLIIFLVAIYYESIKLESNKVIR